MNALARFFIRRPVASGMLALAIVLAGLLPVAWLARTQLALPHVDTPTHDR